MMTLPQSSPRRRAGWSRVCAAVCAAASLAIGASAHGQAFSTTFDEGVGTYPQPRGSLSGQNGWDTNDAAKPASATYEDVGQTDYVGPVTGYGGSSASNYQGGLGGYYRGTVAPTGTTPSQLPGSKIVYLYHAYSPGAATSYVFNTDFDLSFPAAGAPNPTNYTRDSFGFNFQTSGLANLFSVNFTPDLSGAGNSANQMIIGYSVNEVQTIPLVPGASAITYNSIYHLRVSVNVTAKTMTINVTGSNSFTISNISLASIDPAAVQQLATTWTLANTSGVDFNGGYTNSGSNAIYFDNFSVVPEPSTWAMLGLGAVAAVVLARRRTRA